MRDAPKPAELTPPRVAVPLVRFGGLLLNLDACALARESGEAILLTRGEFAILRTFVTRPGRVLSRDTLLDALANRRFEAFDRSVDVLVGRLRRKIESDPKKPRLIVTVSGEGYRFDGFTKAPQLSSAADARAGEIVAATAAPNGDAEQAAAELKGDAHVLTRPQTLERPRLSIIVLPFTNLGGDRRQEYFVDGVTNCLTTDLSRMRGALVIARSTAFTYKGTHVDARSVGCGLNVRYVLEGSIQRSGNRVRVNAQLIDAETGNHLWAERFDKPLADLFDMQDEVVAHLAGALNAELAGAEARRAERASKPDSMDLYFQGLAWLNKGLTPGNLAQARSLFDRARTADPSNVDALVGSAVADIRDGANAFVTNPSAAFAAAEVKLTNALSSVPDHAHGNMWLGLVDIWTRRPALGIAVCEYASHLDRNLAHAHAIIGRGKVFVGRAEETEEHVVKALRLSPRDTMAYIWMYFAGLAKLHIGSYEQAIAWFRRAIETNRNYPAANFQLAAALAQVGRMDEAHSAAEAGLALNPIFAIARARANWTALSDDRTYLGQLELVFEGMHKAGVPEGAVKTT